MTCTGHVGSLEAPSMRLKKNISTVSAVKSPKACTNIQRKLEGRKVSWLQKCLFLLPVQTVKQNWSCIYYVSGHHVKLTDTPQLSVFESYKVTNYSNPLEEMDQKLGTMESTFCFILNNFWHKSFRNKLSYAQQHFLVEY